MLMEQETSLDTAEMVKRTLPMLFSPPTKATLHWAELAGGSDLSHRGKEEQ